MKEAIKLMPETTGTGGVHVDKVYSNVLPSLDPESQQILDAKDKELKKTRSMGGQHVDSVYPNALPPLNKKTAEGWTMRKPYVSPYSGKRELSLTAGQSPAGVETSEVKQPPETLAEPEGSAETKPDLAKVEQSPEELSPQEKVDSAQKVFEQAVNAYSNTLHKDQAFNSAVRDSGGQLNVYKDALKKSGLDGEKFGNTSEGRGILDELERRMSVVDAAEKAFQATEGGKKLFEESSRAGKNLNDAKKALAPTEAVAPPATEAKPDGEEQAEHLRWLGVDVSEGRDSGPMEKGRQRRLALQKRAASLIKIVDAVLGAPDAIGREVSDRKREQLEQFRQIRDRVQKAWGEAEARLMMTAEDVSSKTMGAVDKLTKAIGSNIVKALRVDRDAVISGWESAQADFEKGIENRPPRQTRADWNEAAAKRMEDRLSQMQEGDRGYDHLRKKAEKARATGKRLRKKAEEDRARAEAARGSRKGMFSFLRKPSV